MIPMTLREILKRDSNLSLVFCGYDQEFQIRLFQPGSHWDPDIRGRGINLEECLKNYTESLDFKD